MTDCPHIHQPDTGLNDSNLDRTELYAAYKDWCLLNRINPVGAHRLYKFVWEIFRVETRNTNGRRLFRGIQLVTETTQAGAAGADGVQA